MKPPASMQSAQPLQTLPVSGDLDGWLHMLEKIAEGSANMIVVTDPERRIRWVNRTYTHVTGWTLEECLGKRPAELLHGPKTDAQDLIQLAGMLRQGRPVAGFELINYRKSGEAYVVNMNIEPIRDGSGSVYAYLSIQADVTERRALETRASKLNKRLEEAQRLARLGWVEDDPVTSEPRWSDEVFRLLGMEPDHIPRGIAELLSFAYAEDISNIDQTWKAARESGEEICLEFRITGAHHGRRWVRCRGMPVRQKDHFAEPETWSVQDITFYKSRFEEKARHNELLSQQVAERTRKLEVTNLALEKFSYALSHDLRTPLRHVASFSELLQEELILGRLDTATQYAQKIVTGARQMQSLIEAMLSFARLGRASLKVGPLDLHEQIRDIANALEADSPGQRIEWHIAHDLPTVQADPVLMREVWVNLLNNALKYSRHREVTRVHIGWRKEPEGWIVSARDNGVGFDSKHATRLFDMFERLHSDTRFEGLGVGLALVRQIVESHGGRIWAQSVPDEGATFSLFLPFKIPLEQPPNAEGPLALDTSALMP